MEKGAWLLLKRWGAYLEMVVSAKHCRASPQPGLPWEWRKQRM